MSLQSICIATPDVIGPVRNGGIGSACFEIAKVWSKAGHHVTVLFVNASGFSESENEDWRDMYDDLGISFAVCPSDPRTGIPAPLQLPWNAWQWLKKRDFDTIYFPEWRGVGLYTIQAKQAGLAFRNTQMIVGAHSPSLWHAAGGMQFPAGFDALFADAAERQSIAFADMVISPSQYMIDYMGEEGWELPKDVRVIPNPLTPPASNIVVAARNSYKAVHEVVFFGRLETRKGLLVFVRALALLPDSIARSLKITFLGKPGAFEGGALNFIHASRMERFAAWQVLDDYDSHRALAYLSVSGRMAVIASLTENAPMTVRDCIAMKIPFLASDVGGISELIADEHHAEVLFVPQPAPLASAILRKVKEGAIPVRPAYDEDLVTADWMSALEGADNSPACAMQAARVSVVVTTFNRPEALEDALNGLRLQTMQDFEVVVVDDGSTEPAAIAKLDSLKPEFAATGWTIVRQQNAYLGAARNAGWRHASGEYVIFHDDDNYSSDVLVETYARAMMTSGADVATCMMAPYSGERPAHSSLDAELVLPFVGNAYSAGLYGNLFGDAHACFRRSALEKIGGFTEDYGVGHEDWEIFARASLMGLRILNVPEPLFWYHEHPTSMLRSRISKDPDLMRSLRPYLDVVPSMLRPALQFAVGQYWSDISTQTVVVQDQIVETQASQDEMIALGFSMLPASLRSETALREACAGGKSWVTLLLESPRISVFALGALRRLNRVGADRAQDMDVLHLILCALPRKLRTVERINELATFVQSWERVLWRHPLKISYWQAARALQYAVRERRKT